jgi:hypothetical protein
MEPTPSGSLLEESIILMVLKESLNNINTHASETAEAQQLTQEYTAQSKNVLHSPVSTAIVFQQSWRRSMKTYFTRIWRELSEFKHSDFGLSIALDKTNLEYWRRSSWNRQAQLKNNLTSKRERFYAGNWSTRVFAVSLWLMSTAWKCQYKEIWWAKTSCRLLLICVELQSRFFFIYSCILLGLLFLLLSVSPLATTAMCIEKSSVYHKNFDTTYFPDKTQPDASELRIVLGAAGFFDKRISFFVAQTRRLSEWKWTAQVKTITGVSSNFFESKGCDVRRVQRQRLQFQPATLTWATPTPESR